MACLRESKLFSAKAMDKAGNHVLDVFGLIAWKFFSLPRKLSVASRSFSSRIYF